MGDRVRTTVWNWQAADRGPAAPGPARVCGRTVWAFLAAGVLLICGHRLAGGLVGILATALVVLGLLRPGAWARLAAGADRFGQGAGRLLGWVVLTPVFLLVVVPGGLLLRLRGRDPLHRRFRPAGRSYWIRRRRPPAPAQYDRQFLVEDRAARAECRPSAADPEAGP